MSEIDIDWVFTRIPLLRDLAPGDFDLTPLPGYTNLNYRLHNREHDWVLRLPKHETNRYIDRAAEARNQALAAELGLAPVAQWRDASGITLTDSLASSRAVTAAEFGDPALRQQIIEQLQKLHRSGVEFSGDVNLGEILHQYFALLDEAGQQSLQPRMDQAGVALERIAEQQHAAVPSHNDLVLENLLLSPDGLWLIDWEYSSMASPYWDIATLCIAAQLNSEQGVQLLNDYSVDATVMDPALLEDYRELLELLSDCWMAAFVRD